MLYKGDKGVDAAARPPEGGPVKAWGLLGSSLPGMDHLSVFAARPPEGGPVKAWGLLGSSLPGMDHLSVFAARPPEGGPAEAKGLSTSSLPLNIDRPARMPDSLLKSLCTKQWLIEFLSFPI